MKKYVIFVSAVLISLISFQSALAVNFFGDDELYVDEIADDDTYAAGGIVNIDNNIEGDLYVAGGSVIVNGNIDGDLVIAGGTLTVNGDVNDDIRAGGGNISINGNVGDDLIATGGQLNISSQSLIGGSLVVGNGYANILGTVNEDIIGGGGRIVIGGTVYGNVNLEVQDNISLTEDARVDGNLVYKSFREAELYTEQVGGFIEFNKQTIEDEDFQSQFQKFFSRWHLIVQFIAYLSLLIVGFVFTIIAPKELLDVTEIAKKAPWKSMGLGFIILLCTIAACIILAITVLGIPLAAIIFGLFLITMYVAKIFAAMFIGSFLIKPKHQTKGKLFGIIALGAFILMVLAIVPFVGWLISLLITLIAFGAFWNYKKQMFDKLKLDRL